MPVTSPPPASQLNRNYRFGDFEFSVRAGELRRNGEVVRLQQQPSRVLMALLEYSGEVITREEMRDRVWPGDAVQDFDNSLRVAVNKLRQALGDDPENPVYVETLPRRGYRWLYPVTIHDSAPGPSEDDDSAGERRAAGDSAVDRLRIGQEVRTGGGVRTKSLLFTLVLVVAVLGLARYLRREPAPDPKVVPLTTYSGLEYMPSLSPDGTRVAFAWTGPDENASYSVFVKPIEDERARRLTETPADASDSDPVWSADGKSIYFFRRGGGKSGIYVASAEGGDVRQLIGTSMGNRRMRRSRFDVSPDGNWLVYADAAVEKDTVGLFLLDLKTLTFRQITHPQSNTEGDGDPAFSHEGKTIAFQRNTNDLDQIYFISTDGGAERLLTSGFIMDYIDGVAWTSDDREIILGGKQLRWVPTSGSEPKIEAVPYVPGPALFPTVRKNSMVFVDAKLNANVWKIELRDQTHAAGGPKRLISSTRQQAAPSYSPDGSRIAFQSDRSGDWEIWTCARDGSDAIQLTHFNARVTGTPRWSPDGKHIVFDSRASGTSQVFEVSAGGGEPRRLSDDRGGEVPSFSRDGKWIYYTVIREGVSNIWKLATEGSASRAVTTNGGVYAAESYDGKYLYFSRNGLDPTIWRVSVDGGPEEVVKGVPRPFDTSHWVLTESGIYIIDSNADLLFYQFDKNKVSKVYHDPRFVTDWSMAVSPDGREVVWVQIDERLADLVLVKNFP